MRRCGTLFAGYAALSLSPLAASCGRASASPAPRPEASATDWAGVRAGSSPPPAVAPEVRKGAWALHIGDSFVHASLQQNLGPRFHAAGTNYVVEGTTATYTTRTTARVSTKVASSITS